MHRFSPRTVPDVLAPLALILLASFSFAACDGSDDDPDSGSTADAGPSPDSGPEPDRDAGVDAGIVAGAPVVIQTLPADGEEDVDPATSIAVLFSEEMDPTAGSVSLQPGGIRLSAADGEWIDESMIDPEADDPQPNLAVRWTLDAPLQGGVTYTGTVNRDFKDAEGNALRAGETFQFLTFDRQAPQVVEATPAEGSTGLSALRLTQISVTFDEQMNRALGRATLAGGPGQLGDPSWDGATVTWPVSGLAPETAYRLELSDFVDQSGNLFDPSPYLGDGALDFSVGPDRDAPFVTVAIPTEGQRGVNPAQDVIRVTFSEPMDRAATEAQLSDGTTTTTLDGTWSMDDTVLTFDVSGLLTFDTGYTLDLTVDTYRDRAGNDLNHAPYLTDGILDFSVGEDTFGPRVLESAPREAEVSVAVDTNTISVRFDEPMDTSVTTAPLIGGGETVTLSGTWTASDTILDLDSRDQLRAGHDYRLDLRGLQDLAGNPLDDTHEYLRDGQLDFQTVAPSGDRCADALASSQAVSASPTRTEWVIEARDFDADGATELCDSTAYDDMVVQYDKTTGDLASGGTLLRVSVVSSGGSTDDLNLAVQAGACDPATVADGARACQSDFNQSQVILDAGAGSYFIWVAKESPGSFPGATITVEEISAWPEGESCEAPYTTSSAIYTAPDDPDGAHLFEIRPTSVSSVDRAPILGGPGAISCDSEQAVDAVIRFDRSANSILEIKAIAGSITGDDISVEVSSGACHPSEAAFEVEHCVSSFDRLQQFHVGGGPAGPVFILVTGADPDVPFPGATVSVREIPVAEGESCSTAYPISGPTASVTLDSTQRLGGGSCFPSSGEITWFRYTPTQEILLVNADTAGEMVLREPGTSAELGCAEDATEPLAARIASGGSVCIGIPNGSGITSLTFEERAYTGIQGQVTDLDIRRPFDAAGNEKSWTADVWMTTTPTRLYLVESSSISVAPVGGGARAFLLAADQGVDGTVIGSDGLSIGEALFSLDDGVPPEVYQLTPDGSLPFAPMLWETGGSYGGENALAIAYDGASLIVADEADFASEPTQFYALSASAPGEVALVGANASVQDVTNIALDATYLYFVGAYRDPFAGRITGVFRLRRDSLGDPLQVPELLLETSIDGTYNPLFVDDPVSPGFLYVRTVGSDNRVQVVADPGSETPLAVGPILHLGTSGDFAMTYDPRQDALYLFETETDPTGRIVRVD